MKRIGDFKAATRSYWATRNPAAFRVTPDELRSGWGEIYQQAGCNHSAVFLSQAGPVETPLAGVIPVYMVYAFHAKMNSAREKFPVVHVDMHDFLLHREAWLDQITRDGYSLILLDRGVPVIACAHPDFLMCLKVSAEGRVDFRQKYEATIYAGPEPVGRIFGSEEGKQPCTLASVIGRRMAYQYERVARSVEMPKAEPMSAKDLKMLEQVLRQLRGIECNPEAYKDCISSLSIDLGLQTVHQPAHEGGQALRPVAL